MGRGPSGVVAQVLPLSVLLPASPVVAAERTGRRGPHEAKHCDQHDETASQFHLAARRVLVGLRVPHY